MEQQLPKIGGITIKRRSKQNLPSSSSEIDASRATQLSPIENADISYPSQDGNDEEEDEYYDEDEFHEDNSFSQNKNDGSFEKPDQEIEQWDDLEGDGDFSDNPGNHSSENEVQLQSSSEDDVADSFNEIAAVDYSNIKPHSSSIPQLPPGVTIERKKSAPTFSPGFPPNIHLPAGIQLQKRASLDTKLTPVNRVPTNLPIRPVKGALRQVRPQRSQNQNSQQIMNLLQNIPGASFPRQPVVRTVRPRVAPLAPRMMINDFLEQRMHVGRQPSPGFKQPPFRTSQPASNRGPRSQPYPNQAVQDIFQNVFKTRSPVEVLKKPNIQLPPGITMQPRTMEPTLVGSSDSDPDDISSPPSNFPKLPAGINVERKKIEKPDLSKPFKQDVEKRPFNFSGTPQRDLGEASPQIQLPAGISFQRKACTVKSTSEDIDLEEREDEAELGEGEEDEEDLDDEPYDEFENDEEISHLSADADGTDEKQINKTETPSESGFVPEEKQLTMPSAIKNSEMVDENSRKSVPVEVEKDEYVDKSSDINEDHSMEYFPDEMGEEEEEMGEYDEFDEHNEDDVEPTDMTHTSQPTENISSQPTLESLEEERSENKEVKLEVKNDKQESTKDPSQQEIYDKNFEEPNSDPPSDKPEAIDFESLISAPMTDKSMPQEVLSESSMDKDQDQDVMKNLVEMMTKGEIEGEIEDDKEDEDEIKKGSKRKAEDGEDSEEEGASSNKKQQLDEEDEAETEADPIDKSKVTSSHLRKNIREVMDETKLDETTLAAQRQEAERLKRLQEQQRMIREVKRQIQLNKVAQKHQNQSQVLSMLKGNSETSILKKSSISPVSQLQSSTPNHVLLKMGNGQQTSLSDKMRELLKTPSRSISENSTQSLLRHGRLSSSVTIAPIKREPIDEEKKKKKGDVVTLSSDSDDDDCIVLSDEEIESEPEDDPTNSGMHTIDKYNVPDEQGRVLVNSGHGPEEQDVFLAPQIARIIKPHQVGGIRFLFDNIIEATNLYDSSAGFGCILAHSMGLGKTLQIVSFSDIFLRHTSGKKILCIMPINTIQNWQAEFNMWLPKEYNGEAEVRCRDFDIFIVNESSKNIHSRGKVILDWHMKGGVLLMGYELFRLLSLRKPIKSKRKRPDDMEEERNRQLVQQIYCALVSPGPDLVICDEGHRIKNSHATTSQALKQIRTRRRVVLTGYPLQNNLLEYWCMVDFVRPNYLGSKTEFSNMFERPIQNGQCIDSTPQDKRLMRFRAHVLHSLLEGFVQRRSHAVLQEVLPQKEEYVLLLRFTPFQRKLYDTFMNEVIRTVVVPNPLKAFAVCCKIWNHPDALYNFLKKKGEQRDLDLEEALAASAMPQRMPIDIGMNAPMPKNVPVTPPWPKKGPGSRGGKVRQKKGFLAPNVPPPPSPMDKSSESLPSMSQFSAQSSNFSSGYSSAPSTPNYQANYFPQQQGQQPPPQTSQFQQHQNDNYYQTGFDNQTFNSSNPQMYGNDIYSNNQQKQFDNNHKMFPNDQKPPQTFQPGFDNSSNNYYPNQNQFTNTNNTTNQSFTAPSPQLNQSQPPFYQQQNEMSVNSAYDYSQSSTDVNHDFPQLSGYAESAFESSNYSASGSEFQPPQQNYWGNNWSSSNQGNYSGGSSSDEFISPNKFPNFEGEKKENFDAGFPANQSILPKTEMDDKKPLLPFTPMPNVVKIETDDKKDDVKVDTPKKDDIPYDWATELFKNYVTGVIENSSKMEIFFLIMTESILKGDRLLIFSQSLLTLDLLEDYLQKRTVPGREENWCKNRNYFRLDGSTPAMEREKLINEFNINPQVGLFLVSTRAGSLGINLVGANRVIVFDASWNPCHDTQAVCRVYRYGQQKPCYVYRLVMDCSLEKKIYDRQINKQGMADRVVDELNPDAHLSIKEVTNLCWDDQEETSVKDFSDLQNKYHDDIVKLMLAKHSTLLSKAPFQHESLLIDRKEKKLSQAEKRLAKRSYELEKQAANQPRNLYQLFPTSSGMRNSKPIASVKPMQNERFGGMPSRSKWIPADVWQKQGMSAQEMTLPLDVVIPTNSPDKSSIVLKAGQRVMVLKSPKGIYMQLETGKIIAIRTAYKVGTGEKPEDKKINPIASALKNNPNVTITSKSGSLLARSGKATPFYKSSLDKKAAAVNMAASKGRIAANNKNRNMIRPTLAAKTLVHKKSEDTKDQPINSIPETNKESLEAETRVESTSTLGETEERRDSIIGAPEFSNSEQMVSQARTSSICDIPDYPAVDSFGLQSDILGSTETQNVGIKNAESSIPDVNIMDPRANEHITAPDNFVSTSTNDTQATLNWSNVDDPPQKVSSLDEINSLVQKDLSVNQPDMQKQSQSEFRSNFPPESKDNVEIKKEPDVANPWAKPSYPMDPYGNFYPGYPGYYAPPMPGYEGYPYPRAYPPPIAIKPEIKDGTPPPAATTQTPAPAPAPAPLYPPYPNPYPYGYNYPPYPPQAQPPIPTPQPTPSVKPADPVDPAASYAAPPYGPRPPYPAPTPAPGYYPNYPPFRPFHDPNYPFPNYNPYMPPGYGYPMQNPHPMQPPSANDTSASATVPPQDANQ